MLPYIFRIGDAALHTYPLMMSLGFFVCLLTWIKEASPYGWPTEKLISLSIVGFFAGLVGARMLFILVNFQKFYEGKWQVFSFWQGGIVFLGGLVAGILFFYWAFPRVKIPRELGFSTLVPGLAFAHALGRLGCFAHGCCYGTYCTLPWGVIYNHPDTQARPLGVPLHPTQLYEAAGLFILGIFLVQNNQKRVKGKKVIPSVFIYLIGYGILRFAIETLRGDNARGFLGPLSTSQWVCIFLVAAGTILRHKRSSHES